MLWGYRRNGEFAVICLSFEGGWFGWGLAGDGLVKRYFGIALLAFVEVMEKDGLPVRR